MTDPARQSGRPSSALAEKLVEFAPDAIVVTNAGGLITEVNPQAERLFGYARAELLGLPVETLIPERFRDAHPAHRNNYGQHPSARSMGIGLELYGRRKDGTEFPVDIMLSPLQVEDEKLFLAVVRDITERKQTEAALQRSEESFRLLVEGVKDYAIFMLSRGGQVLNWNSGAERIKGYRAEEIVGQHFSRFYTPQDIERGKPAEELKIAGSQGQLEDEGWRLRKDGSRFWANVIVTAIRDKNGELLGFSKVTRDFTERKKTEQALLLSEQRFRTLFEASRLLTRKGRSPKQIRKLNNSSDTAVRNWPVSPWKSWFRNDSEMSIPPTVKTIEPRRARVPWESD
jgi:formate hydrogenlyase transcriptional activator